MGERCNDASGQRSIAAERRIGCDATLCECAQLGPSPRAIELDNVQRLRDFPFCQVVCSPAELEAALDTRLAQLRG